MDRMERMRRFRETDLYVVITEQFCAGRPAQEVLDAVLRAGVRLVQFREKNFSSAELYARAKVFREKTREAGALLIVNDRADIAVAVEADGVHIGQEDMPVKGARRVAPDLILGASTHGPDEAAAACNAGADYVNIGPIFTTQTKTVATGAVGPEMIDRIAPSLRIPFTCMGGIKAENISEVLARGARHPAVVTAVTAADDVEAAARELREIILRERRDTYA
jgi:thiamine-phosphate pyrophosphorylase